MSQGKNDGPTAPLHVGAFVGRIALTANSLPISTADGGHPLRQPTKKPPPGKGEDRRGKRIITLITV